MPTSKKSMVNKTKPAAKKKPRKVVTKPTLMTRRSVTKNSPEELAATFSALCDLLRAVSGGMVRHKETKSEMMLAWPKNLPGQKPTTASSTASEVRFFAGASLKKTCTSFYLFPIADQKGLAEGLSKALRAKMQGTSCFNFMRSEPELFAELEQMTRRCKDALKLASK